MKILSCNVYGYRNENLNQETITGYIKAFFDDSGDIAILHEVPYKNKNNLLLNAFPAENYKIEEPKILKSSSYCPDFITLAIFKESSFSDKIYEIQKGNEWARWLEIEITPESNEKVNILGVHVPGTYKRNEFKDLLIEYCKMEKRTINSIIIGDFNAASDNDRKITTQERHDSSFINIVTENTQFLNSICNAGYTDAWREKHPVPIKEYTWYNKDKNNDVDENDGRRLDYVFISESLNKGFNYSVQYDHSMNVAVSQRGLSDHSALILELNGLKTL